MNFRYFRSSFLVGFTALGLVVGCGDDVKKTSTNNSTNNANNTTNNQTNNATNNQTNSATNNTTNNVTNNGTNTAVPNYVALITDRTSGDVCNGPDPGSDIIYVALEDNTGKVLGYGNLKYNGITGDSNEFDIGANLDGTAPSEACPEFSADNVTSLGCGGSIGLMFLDADANLVAIEPGMQIRVSEFGQQCPTGSNDDEFEIFICTDTNAVVNNNVLTSCAQSLGGGSGEITVKP